MMVQVLSAAKMNEAAYLPPTREKPPVPGWTCEGLYIHPQSGLDVDRWRSDKGYLYLAVRGTTSARDAAESLRIFLGQNPSARMTAFQEYILRECAQELQEGRLAVGGHSLGGLVAAAAAARWNLPGLVQNAPGWMVDPPPPHRLSRLLEVRTCRDTVSDWGSAFPRTVTLNLPHLPTLGITSLHAIAHQNRALEEVWFASVSVDDPALRDDRLPATDAPVASGLKGLPSRISRAWVLLMADRQHDAAQTALTTPDQPRVDRPRRSSPGR